MATNIIWYFLLRYFCCDWSWSKWKWSIFIGSTNGVRGVAVAANRQWLVGLGDRRGVHALHKLLFDAVMALAAGCRQILAIDRRLGIFGRQFAVRGVATGASGGYGQAALQQPLAVNAFTVVRSNFMLLAGVAHGGALAFAMALRTKIWNVRRKCPRLRILLAKNAVRAMALPAGRSIMVLLGKQLPVSAPLVLLPNGFVTLAAIHRLGNGLAGTNLRGVYFRVALAASDLGMTRTGDLRRLDEHGAAIRRLQSLIVVATHAIGIGHALAVEDFPHLVRLVAVHAGGQDVRFLLPQFAADGLAVHRFDLRRGTWCRSPRCCAGRWRSWDRCAAESSAPCDRKRSWPRRSGPSSAILRRGCSRCNSR